MNREEFERELGRPLIGRAEFVARVRAAITSGTPFATGKIGFTEQTELHYPLLLDSATPPLALRAFEVSLGPRALLHSGIFPADMAFHARFSRRLADDLNDLDCLGLMPDALSHELPVLIGHGYRGDVLDYRDQEPDRGSPADDERCWLPALRDKRVLLVSPFASLLAARADAPTFEAVWASTGKRFFGAAGFDALEFPYGFEPETHRRYPDLLALMDEIAERVAAIEFDVALIGAGGLGIPIAAFVKRLGRVGFSLGGHLQVLFGVSGERWAGDPDWQRYFNDAWIPMPAEHRPDPATTEENYW